MTNASQLTQAASDPSDALIRLAVAAYVAGRLGDADRAFQEWAQMKPDDPARLRLQAQVARSLGRHAQAAQLFERTANISHASFDLVEMAASYFAIRKLDIAEHAIQRARSRNPSDIGAKRQLMRFLGARGRDDEARAVLADIKATSEDHDVRTDEALLDSQLLWGQALRTTDQAGANLGPFDPTAPILLARPLLTNDQCKTLTAYIDRLEGESGRIGGRAVHPGTRRSTIRWLSHGTLNRNIAIAIYSALSHARTAFGSAPIDELEPIQLGEYSEQDEGHYDWHEDSNISDEGTVRRISLVLQLSAPGDYEGGDLEFEHLGAITACPRQMGLAAVFPSDLRHRVTPVRKGRRYSIVCWARAPRHAGVEQLAIVG